MKRKDIDAAREARLWICQVVIPAATLVMTAMAIPEVRENVTAKIRQTKQDIESKFKK